MCVGARAGRTGVRFVLTHLRRPRRVRHRRAGRKPRRELCGRRFLDRGEAVVAAGVALAHVALDHRLDELEYPLDRA